MADFGGYDPEDYPPSWGDDEIWLFETQPHTDRDDFESQSDWYEAQEIFDRGFLWSDADFEAEGMSPDERMEYREYYFELTDIDPEDFDWDVWREYMGYE